MKMRKLWERIFNPYEVELSLFHEYEVLTVKNNKSAVSCWLDSNRNVDRVIFHRFVDPEHDDIHSDCEHSPTGHCHGGWEPPRAKADAKAALEAGKLVEYLYRWLE